MSKVKKTFHMAEEFRTLDSKTQEAVTCFFNLHNAAHFIYEGLNDNAKAFVSNVIRLNQDAAKIENENSAQVS